MALGFHHIGTFLLFASAVLLLVSTISSPVTRSISLLKVTLDNGSTVTFGALGYCQNLNDASKYSACTPTTIGYDPTAILALASTDVKLAVAIKSTTKALILHPISTGITFFAFAIAAISHRLGFFVAAIFGGIAWIFVLATLIVDFVIFAVLKSRINSGGDAVAVYSTGIWVTVAAFVLIFFGSITTCFSCFTDRRSRVKQSNQY